MATTKELEARIAKLEEQIDDLSDFAAGIAGLTFGPDFAQCLYGGYRLDWKETLADEGTEDEAMIGYWVLKCPENTVA